MLQKGDNKKLSSVRLISDAPMRTKFRTERDQDKKKVAELDRTELVCGIK